MIEYSLLMMLLLGFFFGIGFTQKSNKRILEDLYREAKSDQPKNFNYWSNPDDVVYDVARKLSIKLDERR